ncbi:MAG: ribulose-phosphate 3-epimerase, partial [Bacteroidales bacterium]|nr:ribulose-phosphate 3-epimerase [Bacteroidales bacterium]
VLLMSDNPGFGGKSLIENTYNKIIQLKELINRKNPSCLIEIDGGVSLKNYKKLIEFGADALVAGNAVFGTENPLETIKEFKK